MTPEETKKCIEIMQGYVDGKGLEYKWRSQDIWQTLIGVPLWNWHDLDYRIKLQQVSIPATEKELETINRKTVWIKHKKNLKCMGHVLANDKIIDENWLVFNPDTKCWEDWRNEK